ncbi:elongation factor P maturation arginine rhamnosyltransferase EarP [Diaphorobacter aerolatus]|uniref:Protein-arginine rhamnosyltransferase n=1 Tax=Diaphorobacter aerolatus TaxID=1288495 RepID=A0A7H0GJG6_9BURK|nr:elongation factor P maturation arginine rhamnosyltransferase EarP [Diaphorobacter aerolatus]QNP48432.1 elongation factor P maturation arginine rhamnosyltransferase EarP [Diaphorobacter aerolatus]
MSPILSPRRWDIFCQVIDNFGDIGVCWRLAADLGARGHQVRLFIDDASALWWMAPHGGAGVTVLPWPAQVPEGGPGEVIIEAFGCEIPETFLAAMADRHRADANSILWINLEYLSAESYVERCHRLPSPLMSGPAAGLTRWFFYPGFTVRTGGLLREPDLPERQAAFDRKAWRARQGLGEQDTACMLFCYEPKAFEPVFADTRSSAQWLVTPGRAAAAVRAALLPAHPDNVRFLPPRSQREFDELLWACDLNFVRGEDSLVRALWAGQPFVWQIYPQHDDAHHDKLHAFLDWMQAPQSLRDMHAAWNELPGAPKPPHIDTAILAEWRASACSARDRLLAQNDLLTQMLGFVLEKS